MEKDNKKYPPLHLPNIDMRLKEENGILKVFDPLREKFVAFTPEENVRQHFTAWLRNDRHFPASIMANEIGIELNGMKKRCDTVVFNPDGSPLIIVEYKAPDVPVTQNVFDQIVRYNMTLKAKYLIVSNGLNHYCCVIDYIRGTYNFIPVIPDYRDLKRAYSEN
ncbi:MAG: type I restriction enzyme HsdR N-terminal domain-containing protein [Muribaculaceae bacterium]|nr:type I restriction enzyme HsdR N-terminal domain-containing protein [Muribaculaceae bacterium]